MPNEPANRYTAELKISLNERIREHIFWNPEDTNDDAAKALNCTSKRVRNERAKEKARQRRGKGLTYGDGSNTPENEALSPYVIDSDLREFLLSTYGRDHGLLACLILSQESADRPSLPCLVLAACHPESYKRILRGLAPSDHRCAPYLSSFLRDFPFYAHITSASEGGHARQCIELGFPSDIWASIESILRAPGPKKLVNVFTGHPCRSSPAVIVSDIDSVKLIQLALNQQDLDYRGLLDERIASVEQALDSVSADSSRVKQRSMLAKIRQSPKPLYSAKKNTARIYALGASLMGLCRPARRELFRGYVQFDLKHAQVSIIARLWEAEAIQERLKSGNLWRDLVRNTGVDKHVLKKIVYTITFGGTLANAINEAAKEAGEDAKYHEMSSKILKDPIFQQLYSCSMTFSNKVRKTQSCIDAFGRELFPSRGDAKLFTKSGKVKAEKIRSMKACQAQSFEMAVMAEVVRYLQDNGVDIWLFLHDGIILSPGTEVHFEECSKIVREKAASFGIDMELSMEFIGEDSPKPAPRSSLVKEAA